MTIRTLSIAIICLACATPAAAATAPPILAPASKWALDYGEERCTLSRSFGEGDKAVQLFIHSYGPFSGYRFQLTGGLVPKSRKPIGEIRVGFTPDVERRERVPTIEGVSGGLPAVSFSTAIAPYTPMAAFRKMTPEDITAYGIRMLAEAPAFEAKTDSMVVEFGNLSRAQLQLENMAKPMQALRACAEDLQRHWGLVPAKLQKLTRIATPDASTIASVGRTYPDSKVLQGASAFVPVRIMVDAAGKATQCVVQVTNVEPEFTDAVCDGLARKFAPALDETGQPTPSIYQTSVIYLAHR